MSIIEKIFKRIFRIFIKVFIAVKVIFKSIIYKNKVYLFGIPVHGNLGDQAILLAEEKFLQDNFKNIKLIEIESTLVIALKRILPKLVGDSPIICTGGGFLGSLWINEEEMFRITLKTFPNNNILVFPQTIYFSEDEEGKKVLDESKRIYSSHKNLYICCREIYSYNFMKDEFPSVNVLMIPDMVLYLNSMQYKKNREGVLFCIRRDKEKIQYGFDKIKNILSKNNIDKFDYTDTVINQTIGYENKRKKVLDNKLEQFSNYKLVITDRLHGMVFALLSNTPCLVFENKSYKIKGVYKWIENIDFIELYNQENVENQVLKLLNKGEKIQYDNNEILGKYRPLIQLINDNIVKNIGGKKVKNDTI